MRPYAASSPVGGFEASGEAFVNKVESAGCQLSTTGAGDALKAHVLPNKAIYIPHAAFPPKNSHESFARLLFKRWAL